jgi:2-polyprenyl-3-methyl-5-hydroxy-6-metoxy-1,4-benzoquinol methylase
MTTEHTRVPNHHAHYPGFAGLTGFLAAASMVLGRGGDARLAERLSGLGPGDTVVDVGCGPGAAVRRAARLGASTVGVDPASVMLRLARRPPGDNRTANAARRPRPRQSRLD